jgi:hypothetical protein
LLGTGTEEEIDARADVLAKMINEKAQALAVATIRQYLTQNGGGQEGQFGDIQVAGNARGIDGGRPVESLRIAGLPASQQTPQTPDDIFRSMLNRS